MKKINIIILSILIIFFSVSIYDVSYGTSTTYVTNETTDSIKSDRENNYLQSLLVDGYEIYPEFNKNILTYYIVLSTDVSSLDVTAEPENENAKVKITGNTSLRNTENTIKITVTAENKTTKTYNIIATKQKDNGLSLTSLNIEGTDLSSNLDSLNHYYTFDYKTNKDSIDLDIKATASSDDATIEIVGNKGLGAGENLVTIILKDDKNTSVYEVLVNINVENILITEVENNDFFENIKEKVSNFFQDIYKVIALLSVIAVILVFLIINVIVKLIKNKKADKNRERLRKRVK